MCYDEVNDRYSLSLSQNRRLRRKVAGQEELQRGMGARLAVEGMAETPLQ